MRANEKLKLLVNIDEMTETSSIAIENFVFMLNKAMKKAGKDIKEYYYLILEYNEYTNCVFISDKQVIKVNEIISSKKRKNFTRKKQIFEYELVYEGKKYKVKRKSLYYSLSKAEDYKEVDTDIEIVKQNEFELIYFVWLSDVSFYTVKV